MMLLPGVINVNPSSLKYTGDPATQANTFMLLLHELSHTLGPAPGRH